MSADRAARRLLLDVLTHPALARRPPPLLLAVNKSDRGCEPRPHVSACAPHASPPRRAACHSVQFVRKRLEKEMCAPIAAAAACSSFVVPQR